MKGLILFDWDNTIVNGTAQINNQHFKAVIQAKVNEGWWIGLNSDTPLKRLQSWWKLLGMNGPIVAEKGAVIWWPNAQETRISQTFEIFFTLRKDVVLLLMQTPSIGLFVGDSTEFIKSVKRIVGRDPIFVALDAYRVCSLGLFVRQVNDGLLLKDSATAERIRELITPLLPNHPLVSPIDLNLEHCFMSVNSLDADKATGVRVLLEKWGMTSEIIMVGDSIADYINLSEVRHFAVGNAQPAFKEKADRIAIKNFTEGCIELLSAI